MAASRPEEDSLIRNIQILLCTFGMLSRIDDSGFRTSLWIEDLPSIKRFAEIIGFQNDEEEEQLQRLVHSWSSTDLCEKKGAHCSEVIEIALDKVEEVYDAEISNIHLFSANGIVVHNCEQSLEDGEMCNLVETFPDHHENLKDYLETLRYAFLYAKTVTLLPSHWEKTNEVMLRNRRIGTSQSGLQQFVANRSLKELKEWCNTGFEYIQECDKEFSELFCIPRSIKTTTIKPSGTVSLIAGATPGMHWPISGFLHSSSHSGKETVPTSIS